MINNIEDLRNFLNYYNSAQAYIEIKNKKVDPNFLRLTRTKLFVLDFKPSLFILLANEDNYRLSVEEFLICVRQNLIDRFSIEDTLINTKAIDTQYFKSFGVKIEILRRDPLLFEYLIKSGYMRINGSDFIGFYQHGAIDSYSIENMIKKQELDVELFKNFDLVLALYRLDAEEAKDLSEKGYISKEFITKAENIIMEELLAQDAAMRPNRELTPEQEQQLMAYNKQIEINSILTEMESRRETGRRTL